MIISRERSTWRLLIVSAPLQPQKPYGDVVTPIYGVKTSLCDEAEPPGVGPPDTT
jgi:hypothetical protein